MSRHMRRLWSTRALKVLREYDGCLPAAMWLRRGSQLGKTYSVGEDEAEIIHIEGQQFVFVRLTNSR